MPALTTPLSTPSLARPVRRARCTRASAAAPAEGTASTTAANPSLVYYTNEKGAHVTASPEEYAAAVAANKLYKASSLTGMTVPLDAQPGVSLVDAMAFAGPAPEKINGRLSMLAVVSALGAEAVSHTSVLAQLSSQATLISLAAVLIAAGSLVTIVEGDARATQGGFWSGAAEELNGRAAMLGFAALLITEKVLGHALIM